MSCPSPSIPACLQHATDTCAAPAHGGLPSHAHGVMFPAHVCCRRVCNTCARPVQNCPLLKHSCCPTLPMFSVVRQSPGRQVPLMRAACLGAVHGAIPCRLAPGRLCHAPPLPLPGALPCTAFCCAGYTPEVLDLLRMLRGQSALLAKPPTRGGLAEYYRSLDGVTAAYCYVDVDEGLPVNLMICHLRLLPGRRPTCKCMTACEFTIVSQRPEPAGRCSALV